MRLCGSTRTSIVPTEVLKACFTARQWRRTSSQHLHRHEQCAPQGPLGRVGYRLVVRAGDVRGVTMRMRVGAPGNPPGAGVYSGTPTQVKRSASSGWPSSAGTSLSTKVIPEALAPRAYASRCNLPSTSPAASCASRYSRSSSAATLVAPMTTNAASLASPCSMHTRWTSSCMAPAREHDRLQRFCLLDEDIHHLPAFPRLSQCVVVTCTLRSRDEWKFER